MITAMDGAPLTSAGSMPSHDPLLCEHGASAIVVREALRRQTLARAVAFKRSRAAPANI